MDSIIVIAAVSITGTIVGIIGTYLVQKSVSERQRRWALEDAEKKLESEREAEQKRIKRELLSKRLDILEEAVKIMINDTGRTLGVLLGIPTFSDQVTVQKRRERFEEFAEEASAITLALDSKDMVKN